MHCNGSFNRPEMVFGSDVELPEEKNLGVSEQIKKNRAEHDRGFRPSGAKMKLSSFHPTIGRYPEWTAGRPKTAVRRPSIPKELEERPNFKPTHIKKSTPCPSVVLNRRNMRP